MQKLTNITLKLGESESKLLTLAQNELGETPKYFKILKKSLDARKKTDIKWIYSIEFGKSPPATPPLGKISGGNVMIVGSGPAGLFCALRLIERGFCPIIIERGENVEKRAQSVAVYQNGGNLNPESNVQFGEGGAGTFSDGKLNTQTHSGYVSDVLATFAKFGAPPEVEYLSKPHIGSDNLRTVLKNIRTHIERSGGKMLFGTKLVSLTTDGGKVKAVTLETNGSTFTEKVDDIVLALGHSARDTFKMLHAQGIAMEARDFAVGVRIEHLQASIDHSQYGNAQGLPAADYKLVSHKGARSCFTFCMCPGGFVMPSASETGTIVTNGMSNYARDNINANSALMVQVTKADYGGGVLGGIDYQRAIEQLAYRVGDGNAPVQRLGDFKSGKATRALGSVLPTYPHAVKSDINKVLPDCITATLKSAIDDMATRLSGFNHPDALLTAPETRFSSPVRILRNASGQSVSLSNLYPCGEGSGYSGGITSSAADGIRIADHIYNKHSQNKHICTQCNINFS